MHVLSIYMHMFCFEPSGTHLNLFLEFYRWHKCTAWNLKSFQCSLRKITLRLGAFCWCYPLASFGLVDQLQPSGRPWLISQERPGMGRGVIKGLRNVLGHAGLWELHLCAVVKRIWITSCLAGSWTWGWPEERAWKYLCSSLDSGEQGE